eukprot:3938357-Rhodomonas_salina.2
MHCYTLVLLSVVFAAGHAISQCGDTYFLDEASGLCEKCTMSTCPVGMFRATCHSGATDDAKCLPCTPSPPPHAVFVSSGQPFRSNNCLWDCDSGYYRQHGQCVRCSRAACPLPGQHRGRCESGAHRDAACVCSAGQYITPTGCEQCSTKICGPGMRRQSCDGTQRVDAGCDFVVT